MLTIMQASILIQTHLLCWKQGINVFNSIEVSSIQRVLAGENLKKINRRHMTRSSQEKQCLLIEYQMFCESEVNNKRYCTGVH